MHPRGKWGRPLTRYGVAGAAFAQARGRQGARVAGGHAACASGAQALDTARTRILAGPEGRPARPRADPGPAGGGGCGQSLLCA